MNLERYNYEEKV